VFGRREKVAWILEDSLVFRPNGADGRVAGRNADVKELVVLMLHIYIVSREIDCRNNQLR
jgi:hypothetical protein